MGNTMTEDTTEDGTTTFGVSSFPHDLNRRIVADRTLEGGNRSQYLADATRVFEAVLDHVADEGDDAEVSPTELLEDIDEDRLNNYL